MAKSQLKGKRKLSGGRLINKLSKVKSQLAGIVKNTKIDKTIKRTTLRVLGGNNKIITLSTNEINVVDSKGKAQKTEITNVIENPANTHLVRRNILTKGAIVKTGLGNAKITSRPGQEGTINGKLI
jgi:small subunit ribosomal protein S8e